MASERYRVFCARADRPDEPLEIAASDRLDDVFDAARRACADPSRVAPDVVAVLIEDTRRDLLMWWLHDDEPEIVREWV